MATVLKKVLKLIPQDPKKLGTTSKYKRKDSAKKLDKSLEKGEFSETMTLTIKSEERSFKTNTFEMEKYHESSFGLKSGQTSINTKDGNSGDKGKVLGFGKQEEIIISKSKKI